MRQTQRRWSQILRKNKTAMTPLAIREQQVELVDSFRFLGTTITNTLKWDINAETIAKKAQQRMFFLRQLKKFRVSKTILTQFYRTVIESVLTFSITVWFGCASIHNKNMLEGIVKTASKFTGSKLPSAEVNLHNPHSPQSHNHNLWLHSPCKPPFWISSIWEAVQIHQN